MQIILYPCNSTLLVYLKPNNGIQPPAVYLQQPTHQHPTTTNIPLPPTHTTVSAQPTPFPNLAPGIVPKFPGSDIPVPFSGDDFRHFDKQIYIFLGSNLQSISRSSSVQRRSQR